MKSAAAAATASGTYGHFPNHFEIPAKNIDGLYRAEKKSWYVVARNFFLLLLNFSAWPCPGAA